jgi:hypothetical protein
MLHVRICAGAGRKAGPYRDRVSTVPLELPGHPGYCPARPRISPPPNGSTALPKGHEQTDKPNLLAERADLTLWKVRANDNSYSVPLGRCVAIAGGGPGN